NYQCDWNSDSDEPSTPQPFTQTVEGYDISSSTFEKYNLEDYPELGLRRCTKDFIKSQYGLDCDLHLVERYDDFETENYPTCKYEIVHKGQTIGTINARGEFLHTI